MKTIFCVGSFCYISTFKHFYDWKVKLFGKFPVTLVMGRHSHYRTCTIASKNIVGNPDWNFLAIDRVDGISARPNPCFFLGKVCTSQVRLETSLVFVVRYSLSLFSCCDGIYQVMLRSQDCEGRTEKRIRTSSKDGKFLVSPFYFEGYIGTS
ncbi:hypothetical protein D8863_09965 [Streptococcus oralis]|uniref:Uncharacterized protein n=1 Tax=Streptococcus oralis TaxID=1303 RepID=A0A3R9HHG2_STROR|nr:hypothetical protein D8863_09965 [Streptococcus oralis]